MNKKYAAIPVALLLVTIIIFISIQQNYQWPPKSIDDCKNFPANPEHGHTILDCYYFFMPPVSNCDGGGDSCIGGLAVQRNDSTLCEALHTAPARDGCLYIISSARNNTAKCSDISNTDVRNKCFEQPLGGSGSPTGGGPSSGSESSDSGNTTPQENNSGIDAAPPETENLTTLCIELSTPELRSQCFTRAAIEESNPIICEGADGTYESSDLTFFYKYSCYYYSSIASQKPEYCSKILIPVAYVNEDECLQFAGA
ncbi:MAG: hypothetical protein NT120_00405 [Candidatus Aenigmarchaeota archaeon]|nr:hypothetical protein [Candidatus Aenigmarchaeota archaeon]